jgi:hypothetical protein
VGLSLTIKGQRELRRVAEDLRRAKGTLRKEMVKAFKQAGQATLKRVKHNIESMTIRGRRTGRRPLFTAHMPGTGIRARISRVTELDISSSAGDPHVRFQVVTDRLGDARNVPYHLDSGKTFRHPIMGNRSSWAGSSGTPWFYDEIKSDRDVFVAECDKAIDRVVEQLERG